MVSVCNTTRGVICVDVPQDRVQTEDPVGAVIASLDLSRPASTDELLRTFFALEVGKRQMQQAEQRARQLAEKRASETVDLLPEHQGQGKPKHVNRVREDVWRKLERIPVIAARIASGELRVDYGTVIVPF